MRFEVAFTVRNMMMLLSPTISNKIFLHTLHHYSKQIIFHYSFLIDIELATWCFICYKPHKFHSNNLPFELYEDQSV